jgi:hypothetical protein
MIVYHIPPIDDWRGWQRPSDLFRVSVSEWSEWFDPPLWRPSWVKAQELAKKAGWDGDIRDGPYVTVLPLPPGPSPVVIGWKQDNNGNCFIASPYKLPWLGSEVFQLARDEPGS